MQSLQRLGLLGRLRSCTDLHNSHLTELNAWFPHRNFCSTVSLGSSFNDGPSDQLLSTSVSESELGGGSAFREGVRGDVQPSPPGQGAIPITKRHIQLFSFLSARGEAGRSCSSISSSHRFYCSKGGDNTDDLVPEQRAAAWDFSMPVVRVTAGPGSGKTRVLIARVKHLVEQKKVRRGKIAVVTFSRRAATDLAVRISEAVPMSNSSECDMFVGTFHSLSLAILR